MLESFHLHFFYLKLRHACILPYSTLQTEGNERLSRRLENVELTLYSIESDESVTKHG